MTTCKECGSTYTPKMARSTDFCSVGCRKQFNNRRATRGAQLYDLFMAMRYDRGLAKALGLWTVICRLAMYWREDDERKRAGRRSWGEPTRIIEQNAYVRSTARVFDGTGR